MKKVAFIFGTRPEAIKLCPLVNHMRADKFFKVEVCITAQHRQMLDQVLEVFHTAVDIDLNLMRPNQSLADLTGRILTGIDQYLQKSSPDLIVVQGDTTTVMAASLAAFYNKIPIAHVEAGLRTGNLLAPWPEEGNRIITGHLADYHFCPTQSSKINLLREGISEQKILVTGNTVIDALFETVRTNAGRNLKISDLPENCQPHSNGTQVVLITGHRRENFGDGFLNICHAIADLAMKFQDVQFVYPVHLNPNVRKPVANILQNGHYNNIHLINPLSYEYFVAMMERAVLVLTDSGGVQEEAPSLGKPVLVMRENTERPEAVEAGTVKLVGTDREQIISECSRLLTDTVYYQNMAQAKNPYGDGFACQRIAQYLEKHL